MIVPIQIGYCVADIISKRGVLVAIQIGYCVRDIISKCGVGLVIYQISYAKMANRVSPGPRRFTLELLTKDEYIEGFPPCAEHGVPAATPEKLKKGILDMILEKGGRQRPYLPPTTLPAKPYTVVVDGADGVGVEVQFMLVNVFESGVDVIDHNADEVAPTLFDVTFQVAVLKVENLD